MKRTRYRCTNCGSTDIRRDASAGWNEQRQEWELVAVYDESRCGECGADNTEAVEEVSQCRRV